MFHLHVPVPGLFPEQACLINPMHDMIAIMSQDFFDHLQQLRHTHRTLSAGTMLFDRDEPVASVYRIESGEVHLLRRQADGAEFILQRAMAGGLLAEASITSKAYHCGAVVVRQSVLAVFSRADVRAMIADNPQAATAFATHLGREVREARMRAEILSLKRVSERLDAWLVWND
ncbi:MAG TPA: Crp/Fnr family transcriptional regulator, partial [Rhodobacteraceae bacterium]|nr:Crp/Fnr family transcriptional regulator [Paracoccaceae bacterium]